MILWYNFLSQINTISVSHRDLSYFGQLMISMVSGKRHGRHLWSKLVNKLLWWLWGGIEWVYDLRVKEKVGARTSHCWCRPTVSGPISRVSTRSMVEWSMISYLKQWYEMIVLWGVVDGGQMETDGSNLFVGCYTLQGIWSCMIITLLRQGTIG